jgi:hypothetical protein
MPGSDFQEVTMGRPQVSFAKRQREQAKRERQQLKAERRLQRKTEKPEDGSDTLEPTESVDGSEAAAEE